MKIDDKQIMVEIGEQKFHCAMDVAINFIGGKWKTVVLWYLKKDKKRFAELKKLNPPISDRMLSITLKQLEDDGLIIRQVFSTKPPLRVEYSLTEFGNSCIPMLNEIAKWGRMVAKTKGTVTEID